MNFRLLLLLWFVATVHSETTTTSNLEIDATTTSVPFVPLDDTARAENELEHSVEEEDPKPVEELRNTPEMNPGQVNQGVLGPNPMPPQPPVHQPMNPMQPSIPSMPLQFQVRVPPFFGNPFQPSHIRRNSDFAPLPPKAQPIFDPLLCPQGSRSLKRDLERPRLHYEGFYLNPKNQDVLFSICGSLAPAHVILIESVSSKLGQFISVHTKNGTIHEPIVINDISDLLNQSQPQANSSNNSSLANDCLDADFEAAFKIFLKFFYVGEEAFDKIESFEVGILVWKLGAAYLDVNTVQQQIEPRIGSLVSPDNLGKVYRFATAHQIDSLIRKWSEFVNINSRMLADSNELPLSCEDIAGDIEYLDRFMEALNVNQSLVISYIRQYLRICPESANFDPTAATPFPRSLLYYRCTIADLKELVKIGFLNYEKLAVELENRLLVNERHFEEKCAAKFSPSANPNFRHVMQFKDNSSNDPFFVGRRA